MNRKFQIYNIGKGVNFSYITNDKFMLNRITMNFITKLTKETTTVNSIIPFILRQGGEEYPQFTMLNKKLLKMYGAFLSADISKIGAYQILDISIIGIDNRFALYGEDIIKDCSELLCSLIFKPIIGSNILDEQILFNEKQFLKDTIDAEINDKRTYSIVKCKEAMCKNEPFAIARFGYSDKVADITCKSVEIAFKEIMNTSAIEVMFVGSGNPTYSMEIFKKAFENCDRVPINYKPIKVEYVARKVQEITEYMDIIQSKLVFGFRFDEFKSKKETDAAIMLIAIYGGTSTSKLFKNIREKMGLCYYCTARIDKITRIVMVDCGIEDKNRDAVQKEIMNQLDICKNGEITESEFNEAKLAMQNGLESVEDSVGSLEDWYISQLVTETMYTPNEQITALNDITLDDIIKVANKINLDTIYFLTNKL